MPSLKLFLYFYLIDHILGTQTVENSDVSSAKSLTEDSKSPGRSFMCIRKRNGLKIGPCAPPANNDS